MLTKSIELTNQYTPIEFALKGYKLSWGKSDSLDTVGNEGVESDYQRVVSLVDFIGKKRSQDTPSKAKIMNLNNNFAVSHCTAHEDPLSVCVLKNAGLVCLRHFANSSVSTSLYEGSKLQEPNLGTIETHRNSGLPKALKGYGNRNFVVGIMLINTNRSNPISHLGLRTFATETKQKFELPKEVSHFPGEDSPLIINKCGKAVIFTKLDSSRLIHTIAHGDVLLLAYELIKSKPGSMTPGTTKETLDGINLDWIRKLSFKIRAGQYRFGLARRMMTPKVGKTGERPLTIASPREKIVQKAMLMVLQELLEPIFLKTSHGPRRGCHTALQMVDQTFRGGKWVIEADITKSFEKIPHDKLMTVLNRHISCAKTLTLIKSGLKAGYEVLGKTIKDELMGTPQGSILSPMLTNLYLHDLDVFMAELSAKYYKGKSRRKNPIFSRIQYRLNKAIKDVDFTLVRNLRRKLRTTHSKDQMDLNFRRLAYVRYVDDFVICLIGPRQDAVELLEQVRLFLDKNLNLELNKSKTLITKFSRGINFLGAIITNRVVHQKPIKMIKAGPTKGLLARVSPRLSFHAPIRKLIDRLVLRGYMRWSKTQNRATPTALRSLVNHDHPNILRLYNSVNRGIINYYCFADNRKSLGSIVYGLKMSCALTLALKYKLRTAAKTFKKYGRLLTCPKTGTCLAIPNTFARLQHSHKFQTGFIQTPGQAIKQSYSNRSNEIIIA